MDVAKRRSEHLPGVVKLADSLEDGYRPRGESRLSLKRNEHCTDLEVVGIPGAYWLLSALEQPDCVVPEREDGA